MTDFTFAEMFSGIGGFRLGLQQAGWHCVWANDNDKYANKIYKKNFGEGELIERDIRKVDADTIPDHTLLTAGFPCQAFSVAGKRKGFKDTRGTLFHDIARVAKAKKPQFLLLENVKGLLSHDEGLTFQIIIESLDELGYNVEWQVLNSKHFGVPQNRERVFIIGHLRSTSTKQIFPIRESSKVSLQENESKQETEERIRGGDISPTIRSTYYKGYETRGPLISPTIDARYGALRNAGEPYIAQTLEASYGKTKSFTNMLSEKPKILSHWRREGNPKLGGVGPLLSTEHVFSLNRLPHRVIAKHRIRRLTPTECERVQGFPDGWTRGVSDTQRYKLLGNAVTVNVIEFLGRRLLNDVKS